MEHYTCKIITSLVLWIIIPEKISPLWCCGTFYLKKCHLFGTPKNYTLKIVTSLAVQNIIPEKLSPLVLLNIIPEKSATSLVLLNTIPENFSPVIIIRCCWRWTRGGCQVLWSLESTGGDDYIIFRLLRSLFFIQRWLRSLLFKDDGGGNKTRPSAMEVSP